MADEIKTLVEEIKGDFEKFKERQDQRYEELKKQRRDDPLLEKEVDRILKNILDLEEVKTHKEKIEELETKLNRPVFELQATDDPKKVDVKMARDKLHAEGAEKLNEAEIMAVKDYIYNRYLRKGEGALSASEQKLLASDSDPDGGYLVGGELSSQVITQVYETSPMRQHATLETMTQGDFWEIGEDIDEADANWGGERTAPSETNTPDVGRRKIYVHDLHAMPKASQNLLEDAGINVESWLSGKVSDKFSRKENTAYITGNGVGRPRGILDYPAGTTNPGQIEQVNSGHASQLTADELWTFFFSLKGPYRMNAWWYMNRNTVAAVAKLKLGDYGYLWSPGIEKGVPMNLISRPVAFFEDMPDISANALPIAYADMKKAYTIVDRAGVRVLRDPFSAKPFVQFFTTKRTGGDVTNFEAIKLMKVAS